MELPTEINWEDEDAIVSGLTSLAICGIEDPVRPEVRISNCNVVESGKC